MENNLQPNCVHKLSARFDISPYASLCFNCSSLIISDESKNEISTIKPPQYSVTQENAIPIFLLPLNNKAYSYLNKKGYIKIRTQIVKKIKLLCSNLKLNKKTFFLALDYLDHISSKFKTFKKDDLDAIIQIAKFCIILASKFQENRPKGMAMKDFGGEIQNNYVKDELFLLQLLDYDLYNFTCYDILMDILHCGFLFNGEKFSINKMKASYEKIETMLYMFTESKYYIEMSHKEIALAFIGLTREILGLEPFNNIIKYIFINNENNFQNYLNYLNIIKRCFVIKESNNSNNYQNIEEDKSQNLLENNDMKKEKSPDIKNSISDNIINNRVINENYEI